MKHSCTQEDLRYLRSFENYAIDAAAFHHREHLRIAYVLIATCGRETAFERLKASLLGLLAHLGVGTGKYHETVTYAWLLAVDHFMHMTPYSDSFDDFIRQNPLLLDTAIMNTHYSRECMQSTQARTAFVQPDREPIPLYVDGKAT